MPIMQGTFAGAREELRVEVDARIHGDVVHVLQAADDLHVFGIGQDRVRCLGERLQAAAAESIHRRAAGLDRQPGHQADGPSHVESLLALLLRVAEHDVFDRGRIDAACARRAHGPRPRPGRRSARRERRPSPHGHGQSACDNNQR